MHITLRRCSHIHLPNAEVKGGSFKRVGCSFAGTHRRLRWLCEGVQGTFFSNYPWISRLPLNLIWVVFELASIPSETQNRFMYIFRQSSGYFCLNAWKKQIHHGAPCIYIFTSHPIVNLSTIPLLDDVFFQKRLDELIKHIFATTGLAIKWHCYTIEFQGRAPSHVTSKSNLYSV